MLAKLLQLYLHVRANLVDSDGYWNEQLARSITLTTCHGFLAGAK